MDANLKPGRTDVVLLSDEDQVSEVLVKAVENLWEAVNELTRLRRTHKEDYLVTIFGSARIQPNTEAYEQAKKLGADLTQLGCGVVTGGGPGLMQAANEGAASVGAGLHRSIGIRVDLPHETDANPFVGKVYQHKTFFSRLHQFMILSDAFIVVPGGVGTLLELAMVWQLLQVRKLYDTPLILIGDMWAELLEWARKSMITADFQLASEVDTAIPQCVANADEAVLLIKEHRKKWAIDHMQASTQ